MKTVQSTSPEDTQRAAAELAAQLRPGATVALNGPLGSGKTVFVKGLARALGITELVTSPSFSLVNEYEAPTPLYHIDLYRISGEAEAADLDLGPYFSGRGITVVEWAERAAALLPGDALEVTIAVEDDLSRTIRLGEAR